MKLRSIPLYFAVFVCILIPSNSYAEQKPFNTWLDELKNEAVQQGIDSQLLEIALRDIQVKPRIIELDRKQPEGRLTFAQYKKRVITKSRIRQGQDLLRKHRALLDQVSKKYDVQPQYIVALWGIETSYGNNTGGFRVVEALANLAYDGRRSEFFRSELLKALQILQEGHIEPSKMKGSWAGAMGQNQFMPSSFLRLAVDGNDDGKRDIWTSLPDVFASTANYLSTNGWRGDERWGRPVSLPSNFSKKYIDKNVKKDLKSWSNLGVTLPGGGALPVAPADMKAYIVQPDGSGSQAYLAYKNYSVVMSWNRSTYFATSVGILADAIAQTE